MRVSDSNHSYYQRHSVCLEKCEFNLSSFIQLLMCLFSPVAMNNYPQSLSAKPWINVSFVVFKWRSKEWFCFPFVLNDPLCGCSCLHGQSSICNLQISVKCPWFVFKCRSTCTDYERKIDHEVMKPFHFIASTTCSWFAYSFVLNFGVCKLFNNQGFILNGPSFDFFVSYRASIITCCVAPALCTFSLFLSKWPMFHCSNIRTHPTARQRAKRESELWKSVPLNLDLGTAFL